MFFYQCNLQWISPKFSSANILHYKVLYYSNINEKQTQKCSHILFSEHLFSKIFLRNSPSKNTHVMHGNDADCTL